MIYYRLNQTLLLLSEGLALSKSSISTACQ
jgi:hypothetical protein